MKFFKRKSAKTQQPESADSLPSEAHGEATAAGSVSDAAVAEVAQAEPPVADVAPAVAPNR